MHQRKKSQSDRNINYKNLITQYYDKDPQLTDVNHLIRPITPQIQLLSHLNEFQNKIDALIKTKRYDIQEMFMKPTPKLKKVLRLQASCERINQQYLIKIIGRLYPQKQSIYLFKFTNFFRQISLTYGNESQPAQIWKKPTSNFQQRDGLSFKLIRKDEANILIQLNPISNPPKYQIESNLQKITGMRKGTRVEVLQAFWLYVKKHKLQDSQNKQIINADDNIRNIFKLQKIAFATVNNRIRQLLTPAQPYRIELSSSQKIKVFDLIVEIDQKPNVDIVPFFSQKLNQQKNDHPFLSLNSKIKKIDKKFQDHTQKLRRHLMKKQIYKNFQSETIQAIVSQQHQLLKKMRQNQPIQDYNRLEFLLQNQDEVQKQIKHYFEHISSGTPFVGNQRE